MSETTHPTPYAVRCHGDSVPQMGSCGIVYLQREGQHGYLWQLDKPNSGWYCPTCGSTATFQDDIYEEVNEAAAEDETHDGRHDRCADCGTMGSNFPRPTAGRSPRR